MEVMNCLIQKRNFLLGAFWYEWIRAIEAMKFAVDEINRHDGNSKVQWAKTRKGNPWHMCDGRIIGLFQEKKIEEHSKIQHCAEAYKRFIECVAEAREARDFLAHKIGHEWFTTIQDIQYGGPDTKRQCDAIEQQIKILRRYDLAMKNFDNARVRFLEEFGGIEAETATR